VGQVALSIVSAKGPQLSNFASRVALASADLVDLAITLHRMEGAAGEIGLELFEKMIQIDAYGARETLDQLDGRLKPIDRNVPRRTRRRKKRVGQN